jgi:hypothetical protein
MLFAGLFCYNKEYEYTKLFGLFCSNNSVHKTFWFGHGTHCTGIWVDSRVGLDGCGKSRPPPGFDPLTVQPVASRYTNWAILVHVYVFNILIYIPLRFMTLYNSPTDEGNWTPESFETRTVYVKIDANFRPKRKRRPPVCTLLVRARSLLWLVDYEIQ